MKIKVISKSNLDTTISDAIISISSHDKDIIKFSCKSLNLQFDDVLEGEPHCMTEEDANKIVEFVKSTSLPITVQCEGGVSRSAGVSAAIEEFCNGTVSDLWTDGVHAPNEWCYKLVLNAFGIHVSEEKIQQLVDLNTLALLE